MSVQKQDLTGKRFGRLTALCVDPTSKKRRWILRCDCGNETTAKAYSLNAGYKLSCGCLPRENHGAFSSRHKHGMSRDALYVIWQSMLQRCHNPNNTNFGHYGARGISVCERWEQSFETFLADMGPRPSGNHSLDRVNNDGNYEPGNCRWASRKEQAANTSRSQIIEFQGEFLCLSEWNRRAGLSTGLLRDRLSRGWSMEDAMTTKPLGVGKRRDKQTLSA